MAVIVTTNFDRLLENALRERGVEPTVVSSIDALSGAEPLAHSACYILKLHGDYKDARILNTDSELSAYPAQYEALLDRIFDEYGLIVTGWSGKWDSALRAAFMRAPNRRYPVYWTTRGRLSESAEELASQRKARIVSIKDADSFFVGLNERVETLAKTHRQNPLGIDLLVGSVKRYLTKPEYRIQLDEVLTQEVQRLLDRLDSSEFLPSAAWSEDGFKERVGMFESATEPLARATGVLGRWRDGNEYSIVADILRAIRRQADKQRAGVNHYIHLRSYPAILVMTAYGIGLTRAERWGVLHRLFVTQIDVAYNGFQRVVDFMFLDKWECSGNDLWNLVMEKRLKRPLSDHLFALFTSWQSSFAGVTPDFELLFEKFEVLGSLAFFEKVNATEVKAQLAKDPRQGWEWMPIGRAGWNNADGDKIVADLESSALRSALLEAQFANGNSELLDAFIANFNTMRRQLRFW